MPAVIGWLIEACSTIVGRVLLALGISYVSYKGLDGLIDGAKQNFFSSLAGLDPTTVQLLGAMKVGQCVTMICSALVGRLTLAGLTSSGLRKMVLK